MDKLARLKELQDNLKNVKDEIATLSGEIMAELKATTRKRKKKE